jgi:rod shape determining protein RodA
VSSTPTNVTELDKLTLAIYIGLVSIGWLMIYAVNYDSANPLAFLSLSAEPGKQLLFVVACFALLFFILMSDWAFWRTFAFILYGAALLLMLGPILIGKEINGAYAWYQLGGFSLQPAEFAKFGTCLALAGFLSSTGSSLRETRNRMIAMAIFLIPILIIVLQKDVGSALVFLSFVLVLYREGLSSGWYTLGFGAIAMVILGLRFEPPYVVAGLLMVFNYTLISRFRKRLNAWRAVWLLLIPLTWWWEPLLQWALEPATYAAIPHPKLWVLAPHLILCAAAFLPNYLHKNSMVQGQLQLWILLVGMAATLVFSANFAYSTLLAPHQQVRIKLWLRPWEVTDTRGAAYNLIHSKMAIGAGGVMGKGFLEGNMTRLRYVPEQSTDYIFCTVGEEHGFIGTASVLIIFGLLLYRLTVLAERQRSNFSRIFIYCVTGIVFVHFLINTGMTMGLFPTIGIPLPFISYGGSSLIGFTLMIGVVLKLDSHRSMA